MYNPIILSESAVLRFSKNISPVNDLTGCRNWLGQTSNKGYGQFWFKRKVFLAHRIAWTLANGAIPDRLLVLHKCDNPLCCNVDHLFLGTHRDNTSDMIAKGRIARGANKNETILTDETVKQIKRLLTDENLTQDVIAKMFGVTRSTISLIKRNRTWKHVG